MHQEKKRRIVLVSVLKPVNDTRMFDKMAMSLSQCSENEIHVIGASAETLPEKNIDVHPSTTVRRISFARIILPWKILIKTMKLKPDILIVCTHELLLAGLICKMTFKCKLIYDVQENYLLNILHSRSFPFVLKNVIGFYVRWKEILLSRSVDHFLLAEGCYVKELPFLRNRFTILENKVRKPPPGLMTIKSQPRLKFLFSGTLAETTGVFMAIQLIEKFYAIDQNVQLTVIGYTANPEVRDRLKMLSKNKHYIQLIGIDQLVPHRDIIDHINNSDVGIISYPYNTATRDRIPTKLYEYMGYRLPIMVINNKKWVDLCDLYHAGVSFDAQQFDAPSLFKEIQSRTFYDRQIAGVYWEDVEEPTLLAAIKQLCTRSDPARQQQ